jgi:hypothetical protein
MKLKFAIVIAATVSLSMSIPVYAEEWKQDSVGWWYQMDDGSYPSNQWKEIAGKQYYFGSDGYLLVSTTTPDGKSVGADGALIEDSKSEAPVLNVNSYQSILDYYTWKIENAVPGLIAEYNAEAANNTGGLQGLAEISNNKVVKLAEIESDGVTEMAKLYYRSGSGKYSEYEEWAMKLYDVYSDGAMKIYDAYMDSAM